MSEKFIKNFCAFDNSHILNIAFASDIICKANGLEIKEDANNAVIWVDNKNALSQCAQDCLKKYDNAIVISGFNGLGYISLEGESFVAEAWKNKIFNYSVTPDIFGIKQESDSILKCENSKKSYEIIQDVFDNKLKDGCYNAIIINSALALYISKISESIYEGMELAKKTIEDTSASKCLKDFQHP